MAKLAKCHIQAIKNSHVLKISFINYHGLLTPCLNALKKCTHALRPDLLSQAISEDRKPFSTYFVALIKS